MKITEVQLHNALTTMSEAKVIYPTTEDMARPMVEPLIDWFQFDAQEAVDFGVLKEPKFHSYSDIRIMEKEWFVSEILKGPFKEALTVLGIEVELEE